MRKATFVLLCGSACLAYPGMASAQTATAQAPRAIVSDAAEDIIVTARKRDESILRVPVVMTAITEQQLERYSTHDLYTVAAQVPGLLIGTSLAANGLQVSLRGIGTTANNATIDNSISLNVDGIQLSQGLAYNIGMFDVGQVEVLKGPQALFYGKNSPAGVISLRSVDPTSKFELIGKGGYEAEAREKVGELIVSGPVSDTLRLRAGVHYSDQDGFFKNKTNADTTLGSVNPTDRRVTPTKDLIARGTAIFEPSPSYTARAKLGYERLRQTGAWPASQLGYCPEGTGGVAPRFIAFLAGDDCTINRTVNTPYPGPVAFTGLSNGGVPFNHMTQILGSLEQTVQLTDALTLTAVSGAYRVKQNYLYATSIGVVTALVADSAFRSRQFTQEVRLASDFDGPINFTTGAFYQDGTMDVRVNLRGNTILGLPTILQQNRHHIDINSASFFGQLNWKITPTLEFAPGARWTQETRKHQQFNDYAGSGPLGFSSLIDPRIASNNLSPEATLTYTPTNDLTVFAAYKTGFKSGSFNGIVFTSPTTKASFGDEKVRGGEVGMKARMADRQIAFNLAGYYYRYSNLQVGANEISGTTGVISLRTLNAASANVYGVDFDAKYSPRAIPGLNLSGALSYNHARYASFPNAPCGNGQTIAQGCDQIRNATTGLFTSQDLSGRRLVRAPAWTGSAGIDYEMPLGDKLAIDFGSFVTYTSRFSTTLVDIRGFDQKAYAKANASVTLKDAINDRWQVSLIGNNLGNRIVTANCFNSNAQNGSYLGGQIAGGPVAGVAGGDEANCAAERGRELWLRFTVKMGN